MTSASIGSTPWGLDCDTDDHVSSYVPELQVTDNDDFEQAEEQLIGILYDQFGRPMSLVTAAPRNPIGFTGRS